MTPTDARFTVIGGLLGMRAAMADGSALAHACNEVINAMHIVDRHILDLERELERLRRGDG